MVDEKQKQDDKTEQEKPSNNEITEEQLAKVAGGREGIKTY